jgi:hypothetical protein
MKFAMDILRPHWIKIQACCVFENLIALYISKGKVFPSTGLGGP